MRHSCISLVAFILLCLLAFPEQSLADVITAKDTVTGIVIGRNKEPIPGAKVEIVGQPYSVFTDIDGRFNIKCEPGAKKVLVSYPKARNVKKKISSDMTVQIGRTWRQAPDNYQWFTGANIGIGLTDVYFDHFYDYGTLSYDDHFIAPNFSVMAGRVKKVGWYAKYMFTTPVKGHYDSYNRAHSMAAILGGMVRLGCPLHLKLGLGFGYTYLHHTTQHMYPHYSWQLDMGLLFRIKDNYGIDLSMNAGSTQDADIVYGSAWNFGFVYFFNK